MFEYDTKGVLLSIGTRLLSIGTREGFGKRAGSDSSVGSPSRMRGSDPWVSRKQLAGHAGPTRELPASRGSWPDPTREFFITSSPDATREI